MLEGDQWKYGDAPELSVIKKHIAARNRVLLMLPHYQIPLDGHFVNLSPNGQFVEASFGGGMHGWFPIAEIRILDVLPPRERRTSQFLQH